MVPLYTSPVLMIEQKRTFLSSEAHYTVVDGSGQQVAQVNENRHRTGFTRRNPFRPQRFGVRGPDGGKLLTLEKPQQLYERHVHVYQKRAHIGTVVRDMRIVGSKMRLTDPHGATIGEVTGNWSGWDFQILRNGTEVATINKKFPGLTGMFGTKDSYALEIKRQVPLRFRKLVVAAAIAIDQFLHEDESDSSDRERYGRRGGLLDIGRGIAGSRRSSAGSLLGGGKAAAPKRKGASAKRKSGGGKPKKKGGGKGKGGKRR